MPPRTSIFKVMPWDGGVNSSLDPSMIPPNQVILGDNYYVGTRTAKAQRDGINHNWDNGVTGSTVVVATHDFWFGTTVRSQMKVAVHSDGKVYSYTNNGVRTQLTDTGTAWTGTLTSASLLTFGNKVFIAVSGAANVMKYWDGAGNLVDVPGTPPKASILREHLGRIWCNDKSNPDMVYYSPTGDYTQWMGLGDSGGFPIGEGDGDPIGINGISPTFKATLFVGKLTKLYKVSGYAPEEFFVEKISDGIGFVSHNAIAPIDQDDLYFVSEKGVHSMNAVQAYGDFASTYVSVDIQKTFNDSFNKGRLQNVWASYNPQINEVAFTFSSAGVSHSDQFWLYHIPKKNWHRWPGLSCESLVLANDSDKKRWYIGTNVGRVSKTFNGSNYDVDNTGANQSVPYHLTTGNIYVDGDAYSLKAFKSFTLFYKPSGSHTITANFTVDNYAVSSENSLSFAEVNSTALVGSTFITGSSVVGSEVVLAPYTRHIDGIGRGCKIDLTQSSSNGSVEIQGFAIEWEPAGHSTEVILN